MLRNWRRIEVKTPTPLRLRLLIYCHRPEMRLRLLEFALKRVPQHVFFLLLWEGEPPPRFPLVTWTRLPLPVAGVRIGEKYADRHTAQGDNNDQNNKPIVGAPLSC